MAQEKVTTAASQGGAQGKASKNSTVIDGIGPVVFWERCKGETLKLCKEGMKAVEKKVAEKLQGLGQIIIYDPTDKGICLLQFGGQTFIGVVKIGINLGPMYYGCIRVSRVVGTENSPQDWQLEGFIISEFPDVVMVEQGQYDISLGPQRFPKGWVPCGGDVIKNAMNDIKKQFFETAKKYGYVPIKGDNGYDPTDSGITLNLTKDNVGVICYIGFVQLSKKDEAGFYYASIKVSQFQGLLPPKPFELLGFIIDTNPWLQFVADGVYRVPPSVIIAPTSQDDAKSSEKGSNNKKDLITGPLGSHQMKYIPTEGVQSLVNGFKDVIKQEANISGDLETYQVVSATACANQFVWQGYTVFCKIYIGIDDVTNFTNFIYVKIYWGNTLFYVQSAEKFPF